MLASAQKQEVIATGDDTIVLRMSGGGTSTILKALRADQPTERSRARLRREFDLCRRLVEAGVQGVVPAVALTTYEGRPAIAFEDQGGEPLSRLLADLPRAKAIAVAVAVADALVEVHAAGIVHKDIKPSNIIVDDAGARLIDFGISSLLTQERTRAVGANRIEGTLAYCAPEQTGRVNHAIDHRSDLYSLGATLYELFLGRPPFATNDPLELVHSHIARTPAAPDSVDVSMPPALSRLIVRLLAKSPEDRYQTARGVAADLRRCATDDDFPLGDHDISDVFAIPSRLYGRDKDIAALLAAFERAAQGPSEALWVYGYSGIGKSALIHEVHTPIVERRGYFLDGKFDQYSRNIPYASLIQAFQSLVGQLLTEPEERIAQWKVKLQDALGDSGAVITSVIPQVELIVGPQAPVPDLGGDAAMIRFREMFLRFVNVFAAHEHPLVLFLDDLQWADKPSLGLIEGLLTNPDVRHLLLIGSYRDNEVPADHPLALTRDAIGKQRAEQGMVPDEDLELRGLDTADLQQIVADSVRRPAKQCRELAALIEAKTAGNPFFVHQFLMALHAAKLLRFDPSGHFTWDLPAIEQVGLTDNVVELMTGKLQELPQSCQDVLRQAASVGNRFDLHTLAAVTGQRPDDAADALWPALKEGLLLPLDDLYKHMGDASSIEVAALTDDELAGDDEIEAFNPSYRFLHDRVQQAAYSLIAEEDRAATHLAIGRALRAEGGPDVDLFSLATQYAQGYALIDDPDEKDAVASLFLDAGSKARLAAAHAPAIQFFDAGWSLLADPWGANYDRAWSLSFQRAESEYLGGNTDVAVRLVEELLERSKTVLERVRVYNLQAEIFNGRSQHPEAVAVAIKAVALVGITIPQDPGLPRMLLEVARSKWMFRGTDPEEISALPAATDETMVLALKVLNTVAAAAFFININLGSIVLLKMAQTSFKYGNSSDSAFAWGCYAMVVGPILGDHPTALKYNNSAKRLAAMYPDPGQSSKIPSSVAGLVQHWDTDQRSAIPMMLDGFTSSTQSGDPLHAHYVCNQLMHLRLILGLHPVEHEKEAKRYHAHALRHGIGHSSHSLKALVRYAQLLQGHWSTPTLSEDPAEDEVWRTEMTGFTNKVPIHTFVTSKARALLLLGHWAEARPLAYEGITYHDAIAGNPQGSEHWWLAAQLDYRLLPELDPAERKAARKTLKKVRKRIDDWQEVCPRGFTHKQQYIRAEQAWLAGDKATAGELLDEAIETARDHDYPHDEGMFNERAAAWVAARRPIARVYLRAARAAYERFGSSAVLDRFDREHPDLAITAAPGVSGSSTRSGTLGTGGPGIDLLTVLRAHEAVSGEIVYDKLIDRLMRLAVENAGARRALLILEHEGTLWLRAERPPEAEEAVLYEQRPLAESEDLSLGVVNLVARTREPVLVADTEEPGPFTADPYVRDRATRSILCVPLIAGDRLTGMLYLENDLTTGAFTPERLELLKLLSAQIGASIENAELYARSEKMATAFARFVPRQFLTLLQKRSILDIELGDAVQQEMTVLFADIRAFTTLSERMSPEENFAFLNRYLSRVGPVIRENNGFIDKYIGDAVMALFPNTPDDALRAAVAIHAALDALNVERIEAGDEPIRIGIGVHHGTLMLGTIGEEERLEGTVISDAVNTASRLEGLTKEYGVGILVSESTLGKLTKPGDVRSRFLGEKQLRGRSQSMRVHEVLTTD